MFIDVIDEMKSCRYFFWNLYACFNLFGQPPVPELEKITQKDLQLVACLWPASSRAVVSEESYSFVKAQ